MFDFGMTELLLIGIVALIVVGPKDLPNMFRTVGKAVGKAKGMAREFSKAMNDAADDAGVSEINKTLKAAANPKAYGLDKVREATNFADTDAPDVSKLSEERVAAANAMRDKSAAMATARKQREAVDAATAVKELTPEAKKPAAKKPAAKKPAAKATAAKKPAAKKPAAKTTAKKPAAKMPAAKKPAAKKPRKPAAKSDT